MVQKGGGLDQGWSRVVRDRLQLRIALSLLPTARGAQLRLQVSRSQEHGVSGTRSSSKRGLFSAAHLCSSLSHIFLGAECLGRMKAGIN